MIAKHLNMFCKDFVKRNFKVLSTILLIVEFILMIYYCEDDINVRELTLYALAQAGLDSCGAENAQELFDLIKKQPPQLILLDIMLPGLSGLEVLSKLKQDSSTKQIPVMMLSAKGTEYDKVKALDAGADDYLAKPFGMMELISRCKAILRRCNSNVEQKQNQIILGSIRVDEQSHEAFVDEILVDLSPKEFDLLKALMKARGGVLTREQLLQNIWGISFIGSTRTVDTHVQTLRKKLNDAQSGSGNVIHTVHGIGYRAKAN